MIQKQNYQKIKKFQLKYEQIWTNTQCKEKKKKVFYRFLIFFYCFDMKTERLEFFVNIFVVCRLSTI